MRILLDYHHYALLKSFYYLFKKRFNFNVYLPTGFEWLDDGNLYSCYPNRGTADQMLNSWLHDSFISNNFTKINFNEFIELDIDIIVCSLLENYKVFDYLIKKYNKKCKLILHIGNNNPPELIKQIGVKNLFSSSWPIYNVADIPNKVFARQEFSLELFKPKYDCNIKSIANFKHILENEEIVIFEKLESSLKDWNFKSYGAKNRDGIISGYEEIISNSMREFGFIYHFKKIDEGFGHVIHNAFACGKPVITNSEYMTVSYYNKKMNNTASLLFEDDITIIDISKNSIDDIKYKLEKMSDNYIESSQRVYDKFKNTVNFDKEFINIKQFIERLI